MSSCIRTLGALASCFCISFSVVAQNRVVVIPLGGDGCDPCYAQTLRVAPSGAQFTHPADAMAALDKANPTADSRILIKVAAGNYPMTSALLMRPFIDVEGAGIDKTFLSGSVSTGSGFDERGAIVSGSDNSELRDMTVSNTGGSCWVTGMYNGDASPIVRRVKFNATGSVCAEFSTNSGIFNAGSQSFPKFYDVQANGDGATAPSYGMYNFNGAVSIAEGGSYQGGDASVRTESSGTVALFINATLVNNVDVSSGIARCKNVTDFSGFLRQPFCEAPPL